MFQADFVGCFSCFRDLRRQSSPESAKSFRGNAASLWIRLQRQGIIAEAWIALTHPDGTGRRWLARATFYPMERPFFQTLQAADFTERAAEAR